MDLGCAWLGCVRGFGVKDLGRAGSTRDCGVLGLWCGFGWCLNVGGKGGNLITAGFLLVPVCWWFFASFQIIITVYVRLFQEFEFTVFVIVFVAVSSWSSISCFITARGFLHSPIFRCFF